MTSNAHGHQTRSPPSRPPEKARWSLRILTLSSPYQGALSPSLFFSVFFSSPISSFSLSADDAKEVLKEMLRISTNAGPVSAVKRIGGRRTVQAFSRRLAPSSPLASSSPQTLLAIRSLSHLASTLGRRTGNGNANGNVQEKRGFHATSPAAKRRETFKLADIGEGITECEVIKWCVKPLSPSSLLPPSLLPLSFLYTQLPSTYN